MTIKPYWPGIVVFIFIWIVVNYILFHSKEVYGVDLDSFWHKTGAFVLLFFFGPPIVLISKTEE